MIIIWMRFFAKVSIQRPPLKWEHIWQLPEAHIKVELHRKRETKRLASNFFTK
ncbi:hypothetical protein Z950_538 [Sulfitobacter mediterraneus KCTC 32188]|nr:hypothetical protein Z950_538 [Sulfitobacter mediterraneus KCTC 32188]